MNEIVRVQGVSKSFGTVQAVDNLSFDVPKGVILGIVGPDGAGKTTLLRMLAGVLTSGGGSIEILGAGSIEPVKKSLGYMPQRFSLYQDLTVWENVELLGTLYGLSKSELAARGEQALHFVGLWQFKDRMAGKLSGGMKQKLALVAATLHKPQILLLDEPTTGVDPVARREFWQMLYGLNREGMTIIVATPYMDEAELCHQLLLMHRGKGSPCRSPQQIIDAYPYAVLRLDSSERNLPQMLEGCYMLGLDAFSDTYHIVTDDADRTAQEIELRLADLGRAMPPLEKIRPSLEDSFILFSDGLVQGDEL